MVQKTEEEKIANATRRMLRILDALAPKESLSKEEIVERLENERKERKAKKKKPVDETPSANETQADQTADQAEKQRKAEARGVIAGIALDALVKNEHVEEKDGGYTITNAGRQIHMEQVEKRVREIQEAIMEAMQSPLLTGQSSLSPEERVGLMKAGILHMLGVRSVRFANDPENTNHGIAESRIAQELLAPQIQGHYLDVRQSHDDKRSISNPYYTPDLGQADFMAASQQLLAGRFVNNQHGSLTIGTTGLKLTPYGDSAEVYNFIQGDDETNERGAQAARVQRPPIGGEDKKVR